ncbi:hypothetical protein L1987_17281 [Smallanthus sonchifolius]|uniref:Uncharacterized protein n=1 Tax=Smallanthus sonchifolius TaxID=185202 RepID=A0ACB9IYZ2_9ASTR|nr:hypothetical protein L1987_17281 [Smallanthus sonchifolius]
MGNRVRDGYKTNCYGRECRWWYPEKELRSNFLFSFSSFYHNGTNMMAETWNRASGSQYVSKYEPKHGNKHGNKDDSNKHKAESVVVVEEKKELSGGFDANKDVVEGEDDVVTGLEKLRLFGEEPDLWEELLRQNDQLQEDEVLATESIYGENVFVLDNYNGLRSFQWQVNGKQVALQPKKN